jgi:hypothetical protein
MFEVYSNVELVLQNCKLFLLNGRVLLYKMLIENWLKYRNDSIDGML